MKEYTVHASNDRQGEIHDPGVVPTEDPATGAPDPSVLKEASEQASRGDDRLARALAADTELRRAQPRPSGRD